jgi:hypothetical protein
VSRIGQKTAEKQILRHLRLGKSVRSPSGLGLVRNFILATQATPAIHALCRKYGVNVNELCVACTEILADNPELPPPGGDEVLKPTLLFSDPAKLEEFLVKVHRAARGQTTIQRRLAILTCAKSLAAQMAAQSPPPGSAASRSNLLKTSIYNKLLVLMLIAGILIAGLMIAAYLL